MLFKQTISPVSEIPNIYSWNEHDHHIKFCVKVRYTRLYLYRERGRKHKSVITANWHISSSAELRKNNFFSAFNNIYFYEIYLYKYHVLCCFFSRNIDFFFLIFITFYIVRKTLIYYYIKMKGRKLHIERFLFKKVYKQWEINSNFVNIFFFFFNIFNTMNKIILFEYMLVLYCSFKYG